MASLQGNCVRRLLLEHGYAYARVHVCLYMHVVLCMCVECACVHTKYCSFLKYMQCVQSHMFQCAYVRVYVRACVSLCYIQYCLCGCMCEQGVYL